VSEKLNDGPPPLIGQLVADRYQVEELLGVGGMGSVYRARHVQLRKIVALKTLHPEMTRLPEAVARFEREAIAASRIDHKNVAAATDFGRLKDGTFYLILEYVEGESLREYLHREKCLDWRQSLHVARQIADALKAAHGQGIVHRDLKPENVMLVSRPDGPSHVKVLDFGIAKVPLEGHSAGITAIGSVLGTPAYMSPEQCAGSATDARSDLYSLGIILYEMVNGRLPFATSDALALLSHHLASAPAPMNRDVPQGVGDLIFILLEKEPRNRVQTASELLGNIDAIALGHQDTALAQEGVLEDSLVDLPAGALRRKYARFGRAGTWLQEQSKTGFAWLKYRAEQRIRVKQLQLPVGLVAMFGLLFGFSCVLTIARFRHVNDSATAPSAPATAVAQLDSALPKGSRVEFQRQVERIEMLKVYERSEQDWVLLARGYAELGQWQKCVQAYRSVLSLHPGLKSDPLLLSDMRLAAQDPEALRIVLNLSETSLGQFGVDLLWLIWQQIRHNSDQAEAAEKLRKKLIVLSHRARPSLRVAIELEYTPTCPGLEGILNRASKYADGRSLSALEALRKTTGCGPRQEYDCTPCMRAEGLLDKAIARAREQSPPPLGGE
jgi:serine/threonine-protein kinase